MKTTWTFLWKTTADGVSRHQVPTELHQTIIFHVGSVTCYNDPILLVFEALEPVCYVIGAWGSSHSVILNFATIMSSLTWTLCQPMSSCCKFHLDCKLVAHSPWRDFLLVGSMREASFLDPWPTPDWLSDGRMSLYFCAHQFTGNLSSNVDARASLFVVCETLVYKDMFWIFFTLCLTFISFQRYAFLSTWRGGMYSYQITICKEWVLR